MTSTKAKEAEAKLVTLTLNAHTARIHAMEERHAAIEGTLQVLIHSIEEQASASTIRSDEAKVLGQMIADLTAAMVLLREEHQWLLQRVGPDRSDTR